MSQLPITITGHLTHEPELIKVNTDMYKARLRVASSRRIPVDNADNGVREWRDTDLIYIDVELWGQFAINVKKSLHRGMPVIVVGSVCSDSWLAPDGQNKFRTFIKAFYVGLDLNRYVISSRKLERVYETDGLEAPASGETMPEVDVDRTESMAAGARAQDHDDKHDTAADRRQAAHSKANAAEESFEEAEAPAEQSVGS
ncbi:single-stranded DNA-binding protein [Corynebacterium simulans]